jgi:hypothetical protein
MTSTRSSADPGPWVRHRAGIELEARCTVPQRTRGGKKERKEANAYPQGYKWGILEGGRDCLSIGALTSHEGSLGNEAEEIRAHLQLWASGSSTCLRILDFAA